MDSQYMLVNTTRARHNRHIRVGNRSRVQQFVGADQQRVVRARPLPVTGEWVEKNLEDLRARAAVGAIELRTLSGALVDLTTLTAAEVVEPPQPNFLPDSIARDQNFPGVPVQKYPEGPSLEDSLKRLEEAKTAKATPVSEEDEEEGDDEEDAPALEEKTEEPKVEEKAEEKAEPSKHQRRRGR